MSKDRGNFVSEWFGHRMYPSVVADSACVVGQSSEICPFLSAATGASRKCIKGEAARGVCTINTATGKSRADWLVCPYRALDPDLLSNSIKRLFGLSLYADIFIIPATLLSDSSTQAEITTKLQSEIPTFVYFDEKLGGELSIPPTAKSPEFSFDITVVELELRNDAAHIGRFGVVEIQTMDFHGSYRKVVANLQDGLRLHKDSFSATVQANQRWLSEGIEGPNIANVFKRTFYQMMFKFQLGRNPRCAGCMLTIPSSVWESWQRHLGEPALAAHGDGTWNLLKPGVSRPPHVPSWICVFDLNGSSLVSPSPIEVCKIIATDAESMSYFALEVAPAAALDNISSESGMLSILGRRVSKLWPELGATLSM